MDFSFSSSASFLKILLGVCFFHGCFAGRRLTELVQQDPPMMSYHNGRLLSGKITVNFICYGNFTPSKLAMFPDFIQSLYPSTHQPQSQIEPSVSKWWTTIEKYYHLASNNNQSSSLLLRMGRLILDDKYSFGKSLTSQQIVALAAEGDKKNAINVVLTASDVTVDGFCSSRCGTHGSSVYRTSKSTYIWVGNSEVQCPGQCAWPFHQPISGPQSPPLVPPNNDVGLDGMVINLASLFAGTVTNPFGNGYYQGPAEAPLEAASVCPGVFGKGAYPGYAGNLLVNATTSASYNANGVNGRTYLLPAIYDPLNSTCSTLV